MYRQPMGSPFCTRNLAFVGDYVPRRCGIATFTSDICEAIAAALPQTRRTVDLPSLLCELKRHPGESTKERSA